MVRILVGMYKYSNCLHPRNADFGNSFNPVPSFTLIKAHPLKQATSISSILSWKFTVLKLSQSIKALASIFFIVGGRITSLRFLQLLKEEVRIVVIEVFRRSMEAKLFLPLNPFPNSFTVEGRMT